MTVKLEVFSTQTCPHCPMAIKAAEDAKEALGDQIEYEHIDANENPEKAMEYQIMAVPTVIIDGEVAFVGAPTSDELIAKLKEKL